MVEALMLTIFIFVPPVSRLSNKLGLRWQAIRRLTNGNIPQERVFIAVRVNDLKMKLLNVNQSTERINIYFDKPGRN